VSLSGVASATGVDERLHAEADKDKAKHGKDGLHADGGCAFDWFAGDERRDFGQAFGCAEKSEQS
jgi:hypothetical protein